MGFQCAKTIDSAVYVNQVGQVGQVGGQESRISSRSLSTVFDKVIPTELSHLRVELALVLNLVFSSMCVSLAVGFK